MTRGRSMGARAVIIVVPWLLLQGCFLPRYPGCGADFENRPDDPILAVVLASEVEGITRSAGLSVDAHGSSEFVPEYTVWLGSSMRTCHEIPTREVRRMVEVWQGLESSPSGVRAPVPRPYLNVVLYSGGNEEHFFVLPASKEGNPALLDAAHLTSSVFVDAYGERLEREFRYAGLESLLE